MKQIISLHLPKTAGTSFERTLKTEFGDGLVHDYADSPLNNPPCKRKLKSVIYASVNLVKPQFQHADCIHGHFMPFKYWPLKPRSIFVTWLRDPIERLASHYHYWIKYPEAAKGFRLHQKVVTEKWSFEKFMFSKEMRNTYSKFLWNFPIEKFDFIGITEYYAEDLKMFGKLFFNRDLNEFKENIINRSDEKHVNDLELRRNLEEFHKKDMRLYNKALELRKKRLQ